MPCELSLTVWCMFRQPPVNEEDVNLSIKVPLAKRRYWVAQAKLQGTTITETITEALTKKFGEPEHIL